MLLEKEKKSAVRHENEESNVVGKDKESDVKEITKGMGKVKKVESSYMRHPL